VGLGTAQPGNFRNFQRITAWLLLAGAFWIAGGLAGSSKTSDWDVEGGHMAERCGLFIIIALGESILVSGATFGNLEWTLATATAFVTLIGSVAMWWIYFNIGAERASHHISTSADPGRLARLAYLLSSSARRRHHCGGRRRRTHPCSSNWAYGVQDDGGRGWWLGALSFWKPRFQANER
jgi:low temperature requirement protein LtrA